MTPGLIWPTYNMMVLLLRLDVVPNFSWDIGESL